MQPLTKEEFGEWLRHPGTQALKAAIAAKREMKRQQWEGGAFTRLEGDLTATTLRNVFETGYCKGLAFVEDLELGDLEGERSGT